MRSEWHVPKVSIFTRPDRTGWWVHWIDANGRHRIRRQTLTGARELQRRITADLGSGTIIRPTADWVSTVTEYLATFDQPTRHLVEVHRVLDHFTAFAGPTIVGDFTTQAIQGYLSNRRKQPAKRKGQKVERLPSEHTVAKEFRCLRAFGAWAVRTGYLRTDPCANVRAPRPPALLPKAPEPAEWARLLEAIPNVHLDDRQGMHLLILLAAVTGCREGGLLSLPLDRITLGDTATHGIGLLHPIQKGKLPTVHGLPPLVNDRVAQRISDLPTGSKTLWPHWVRFPRKGWARLCAAVGFALSFHSLRRAAAMRAAEAQAIATAAGALGHADLRVARENYLTLVKIQRAAAAALLLPELPPLPPYAYVDPATMRKLRTRPAGRGDAGSPGVAGNLPRSISAASAD